MDGCQIGELQQSDEKFLGRFLQGEHCIFLETKIRLKILGNLSDQSAERSKGQQQVIGLLVLSDLAKSN